MSDAESAVPGDGKRRDGRRKASRVLSFAAAGVLVVGVAGFGYAYERLNSNIRTASLYTDTPHVTQAGGSQRNSGLGTEKPDAFGHTPLNILLIGSDTRSSAADCRIGGDCGPGANADVEMLVHLSADRSNATVMSIPRDTMMDTPACTDPQSGDHTSGSYSQINSALQYGPACSVAAVHKLTGIPIDHFVMIDFSGVVNMSDAVGGVNVCVDNNVYDPYSGLKLAKGTHTLQGAAALAFLRTRHGFDDGSDLGRTYAQHVFITQMINRIKSAGTLSDPAALWRLANAATKALTVDTGLGSLAKLIGLGEDLGKVPADRITLTTMQTHADPQDPNRVVVDAKAHQLFDAIINDRSLTAAGAAPTASAGATASTASTATATATAAAAGAPAPAPAATRAALPSPARTSAPPALDGAHAQIGNQVNSCAHVGNQYTVQVNGVGMTPIEAYAASPGVSDTAP
ncbi:LCP family protein [Streptacidiphilus sp. EB103A]|uniref:LCP family protein n=1 Tax=Streptacidiphilus sp. EB103A TaxID=3156275 RepID=UPI003516EB59